MKNEGQPCNSPFHVCGLISVLLLLGIMASTAGAATYYIDAASGNDANDGTSPETAWRTVSKINSTAFSPGDNILFKRGQTWRETLDFWSSGTSGNPITFSAYGTGNKPVLDGSDIATGWEPQGTPNIWYKSGITTNPNMIWLDDVFGKTETSLASLNAQGEFYWNSNTLYLYSTSDPDIAYSTILIGKRDRVIIPDNLQYITYNNLTVSHANMDGVRPITASDNLIFDGVDIRYNCRCGIMVFLDADSTNIIIRNGDISYNGSCGVLLSFAPHVTISGNTVHHNCLLEAFQWSAGIRIGDVNSYDDVVENNTVYSNGNTTVGEGRSVGIWLDGAGNNNIIRYNKVYGNIHTGIFVEVTSYAQVYCNLVYSNFGYTNARGIAISGRSTNTLWSYPANNNVIYNNTVFGNEYGILVFSDQSGSDIVCDNIVKNNISVGNFTLQFGASDGGENDGFYGHGNIYLNNCFGEQAHNFIQWGWPRYSTYAAWEAVYCGSTGCSSSLQSDPFFADVSSGDFHLQDTSPAKDKGVDVGLTRDYDGNPIVGLPDLGAFESQAGRGCGPDSDINRDNIVDENDLEILAANWLNSPCDESNNFCDGADLDDGNNVDFVDYAIFAKDWLVVSNCPPLVNAGLDKTITVSTALSLDGTVLDDGFPNPPGMVATQWSKQSGPSTVTFDNANSADTVAHFSTGGTYVLRLTATDSELSAYDEVIITVTVPPLPQWSESADYYVDGLSGSDTSSGSSSQPWATIAKAAATATSGKKVLVWGGQTYTGAVTFSNSGTSSSPITFKRDPSSAEAIINGGGTVNGTLYTTGAKYIVIDGFTIKNGNYGIYVNGDAADGWTIKNCRVTANILHGIYIRSADNSSVFNCASYLNGSTGYGIYIYNSAVNDNVTQCTVYKQKYGIEYDTNSSGTVTDSIVTNNTINGIYSRSTSTVTIDYSDVWNNGTNYNGCSAGTHCKSGNPGFVDPDKGDFTPTSTVYAKPASDGGWMGYKYSSSAL